MVLYGVSDMGKQFYGYAHTVNSQLNPNAKKREQWKDQPNALINNSDTYAYSYFTQDENIEEYKENGKTVKKTYVTKNHPYTVTAHEYRANIPSNACVTKIRFVARMRLVHSSKNVSIKAPHGRFCIYGSAYSKKFDDTPKGLDDGWNNGYYWSYTDSKKLTTSWANYTYTMDKANYDKGGFKYSDLNKSVMGIDLVFEDAEFSHKKNATVEVDLAWVRCEIDYEIPSYNCTYNDYSTFIAQTDIYGADGKLIAKKGKSATLPKLIEVGETFNLEVIFKNSTCGLDGTQVLDVDIPWGTELVSATANSGSFNSTTRKWTVNCNGKKTHILDLTLKPFVDDASTLLVGNDTVGHTPYDYQAVFTGLTDGYNSIDISFDDKVHLNSLACANINIRGESLTDDTVSITFTNDKTYTLKNISFEGGSNGVSLSSVNNNVATLTVPEGESYTASLKVCFYPNVTGTNKITATSSDGGSKEQSYNVLDAYEYHFVAVKPDVLIYNHRAVTVTDTDAIVIDCKARDGDNVMYQSPCNIKMHYLDGLDYIGCVPLEQTHFDPKSTYKDKLLDNHYKNKRYMGKQLASDEDITLNVRLHPQQVPTIQGLIDMDKPVPINANHRCFESDPLNHRGWVELYGITTEQTGNNPHWYKCSIDVKYLTHNLNTRFYIEKGNKIADYPFDDLLAETYASGTSLSETDNPFELKTDGTYYYEDDDDVEDNKRNVITLDNNQSFHLYSRDKLASTTHISFEWSNTVFDEIKENDVERIVSLIDKKTGNAVFTYQYHDYVISDDEVQCSVTGYRNDDDIDISDTMTLRKGVDVLDSEEDVDEDYDDYYGSTLHFYLKGNVLDVVDEGFNGKEISVANIKLDDGEYLFDVSFANHNDDVDTDDLVCFFDIVMQDTILKSQFDTLYQSMYVSPFPVSNKTLLFTREAEEGTVYYYLDDGTEYSYLIDPYYQYANGTDMVTSDGVSIFNLNYGYEVIYIQNGLVRLGFNRLNGNLYLGKYDTISHEYITTHHLHLKKYDDINTKSISDDKIEIQASDSIFTIYRGHPYIVINHNGEDIELNDSFIRVWGEKVGDDGTTELPTYWSLMNDDNLLPSDIGGDKTLSDSDIEVEEITHSDRNTSNLAWSNVPSTDLEVDKDLIFTITGSTDNITDEIDVDAEVFDGYYGQYTISTECDNNPANVYVDSVSNPIVTGSQVGVNARVLDYCRNPVSSKTVTFEENTDETATLTLSLSADKIVTGGTSTITVTASDITDKENIRIYIYEEED